MKRCTTTGLLLLTLAGAPVVVWLSSDHFAALIWRLQVLQSVRHGSQ